METEVISTHSPAELENVMKRAVLLLRSGQVVAFPTETVYGLGGNAFDEAAVAKIFTAKNRPPDNPLIVHISHQDQLSEVVECIPKRAKLLMDTFWPGPLSLVLQKHPLVPDITTGGLNTVVVRHPAHQVAQALITAFGKPIAAPSANLSGKISPTSAQHVLTDLHDRIPLIIDGGPSTFGLESTVVDCTTHPFIILRPGSVTYEQLRAVVPDILPHSTDAVPRSPGMKYRHYSPTAPVILFDGEPHATNTAMQQYLDKHPSQSVAIMWHFGRSMENKVNFQLSPEPEKAAPRLFAALRSLDETHPDVILIQGYGETGLGAAVMNRLRKAATTIIDT